MDSLKSIPHEQRGTVGSTANRLGKIGIWSFTSREKTQRNSKNPNRGDDVIKPMNVDRDVYRDMLLNNVLPAIYSTFPDTEASIFVQQDNAGPHISPDDPDFVDAVKDSDWGINLVFQPPNSPDFNLNDLGFISLLT
jgi:hypothetical protein